MHKLYNALTTQYSKKRFRVPGFGTGSRTLEPVPWNRFLRQITNIHRMKWHHGNRWSQLYVVGQHGVQCEVKRWGLVALLE